MRTLSVNDVSFEITEANAEKLLESDAIYECGEEHDLHLSPDHLYMMWEVEILMNPGEDYVA